MLIKKIAVKSATKKYATFYVSDFSSQEDPQVFILLPEEIRESIKEMTNALFAINDLNRKGGG